MSALIIGGDNLESIFFKLHQRGFKDIEHLNGRKGWDKKTYVLLKKLKFDLVIILVDFINHNVVYNCKKIIKDSNIKTIFSKRSWAYLEKQIDNCLLQDIKN